MAEAGRLAHQTYAEFEHDTCMAQSDYLKLRELLGYKHLDLDPALCYVHCVPALEKDIRTGSIAGEITQLKFRSFLLAMMLCALCCVPAHALEYSFDAPEDPRSSQGVSGRTGSQVLSRYPSPP